MSDWSCAEVRERLPEHVTGRLAGDEALPVGEHLRACAACAAEADLLAALMATRPEAPADLSARIRNAVLTDRKAAARERAATGAPPRSGIARWSLAAAAALLLALGAGVVWQQLTPAGQEGPLARVALDPVPETWMDDDAVVAGAPVLDALTEDALQALLEEME